MCPPLFQEPVVELATTTTASETELAVAEAAAFQADLLLHLSHMPGVAAGEVRAARARVGALNPL